MASRAGSTETLRAQPLPLVMLPLGTQGAARARSLRQESAGLRAASATVQRETALEACGMAALAAVQQEGSRGLRQLQARQQGAVARLQTRQLCL